jgi:hypothetical protein
LKNVNPHCSPPLIQFGWFLLVQFVLLVLLVSLLQLVQFIRLVQFACTLWRGIGLPRPIHQTTARNLAARPFRQTTVPDWPRAFD